MIKVIKSTKRRGGCPIHLIRNRSQNWWWFMMVLNDLSPCWRWSVVLHTSTNVCSVIILKWGILLYFFHLLFLLFAGCHDPSRTDLSSLLATHYGSGVLDMLEPRRTIGDYCWHSHTVFIIAILLLILHLFCQLMAGM